MSAWEIVLVVALCAVRLLLSVVLTFYRERRKVGR